MAKDAIFRQKFLRHWIRSVEKPQFHHNMEFFVSGHFWPKKAKKWPKKAKKWQKTPFLCQFRCFSWFSNFKTQYFKNRSSNWAEILTECYYNIFNSCEPPDSQYIVNYNLYNFFADSEFLQKMSFFRLFAIILAHMGIFRICRFTWILQYITTTS